MEPTPDPIPGVTDDPVIRLLLSGEARTLHEAEEKYLDSAIPEILELLGGPLSNDELADQLHVGESTIKTHVGRVLGKLGLRDRVQAVVFAYENGLIQPGRG